MPSKSCFGSDVGDDVDDVDAVDDIQLAPHVGSSEFS